MSENQESELLQSIRHSMQSKSSEELLAIWRKNDRNEWSDEAFSIIHDILFERFGNVPEQNSDSRTRRRSKRAKEKTNLFVPRVIIFAPASLVLSLILLIPIINPEPKDTWFTVLMFLSMAVFFFVPGFYLGWQSWFQGEQVKKKATDNLPTMKKSFYYSLYTYFLPDRFVPTYFLYQMRFMSVCLIGMGIWMILFLIKVLQL